MSASPTPKSSLATVRIPYPLARGFCQHVFLPLAHLHDGNGGETVLEDLLDVGEAVMANRGGINVDKQQSPGFPIDRRLGLI